MDFKRLKNIAGWLVFAIAMVVYFFSAERTGSLWDCGEFITGAYKLEVVHPPGAALFLLIGRMFTMVAEFLSDDPAMIAFSVNLLSCLSSAFAATFVAWSTILLGKLLFFKREETPEGGYAIALAGAGIAAGLSTAFCTSIWFSAVEGEVYAMSTFFTALTLWAVLKWYSLPDAPKSDRWLVFAIYSAGLSIGVHLLSLLTFPALALFYYFKKFERHTLPGMALAALAGVVFMAFIQKVIVVGIPSLWAFSEVTAVNGFGLPFHFGIFPLVLLIGGMIAMGVAYVHDYKFGLPAFLAVEGLLLIMLLTKASFDAEFVTSDLNFLLMPALLFGVAYGLNNINRRDILQILLVGTTLAIVGFSIIGVVVIRANANTPINMNNPSDPLRLLPYLNREQYGERPLLKGPHFDASPVETESVDRYGQVGDHYEITDKKVSYVFNPKDEIAFPRIGHYEQGRPAQHKLWMGLDPNKPLPAGRPSQADNLRFLFRYQFGWMYWRYFMWNFSGRQNGIQGYYPWDVKRGNWISGIKFIDEARLHSEDNLPEAIANDQSRNKYYMLPLLFGIFGLLFHLSRRRNDFLALLAMFIITGIGIIIYSNQPPNEPRERDYVLVGSFFTYCIWIGMGVLAIFYLLKDRINQNMAAVMATGLVLIAPVLMGFQNFDDHSRKDHSGARDYASNFLESCAPNAIIFTYGDNDTYPLWYAQETEGIRTDVRVVNLSLIQVDWYINQLRRKVNNSPPLKMTLTEDQIRGRKRVQLPVDTRNEREMNLLSALKFVGESHQNGGGMFESYVPAKKLAIPVDRNKAVNLGMVSPTDTTIANKMLIDLGSKRSVLKGDLAVLDIIANNIWERPIYFAVTCRQESMLGFGKYTQLEGLGLRLVPVLTNDRDSQFGMVGNGRVNSDAIYENVMNKFRWGNFDKEELYVDRSYLPSVQSHRLVILRACEDLIDRGKTKQATELATKFFASFPNMNFRYDAQIVPLISVLVKAGAKEEAKKHIRILAKETKEHMDFYAGLPDDELQSGYQSDAAYAFQAVRNMQTLARQLQDKELEDELKAQFQEYNAPVDRSIQ